MDAQITKSGRASFVHDVLLPVSGVLFTLFLGWLVFFLRWHLLEINLFQGAVHEIKTRLQGQFFEIIQTDIAFLRAKAVIWQRLQSFALRASATLQPEWQMSRNGSPERCSSPRPDLSYPAPDRPWCRCLP